VTIESAVVRCLLSADVARPGLVRRSETVRHGPTGRPRLRRGLASTGARPRISGIVGPGNILGAAGEIVARNLASGRGYIFNLLVSAPGRIDGAPGSEAALIRLMRRRPERGWRYLLVVPSSAW
jgi:hypothetical protein